MELTLNIPLSAELDKRDTVVMLAAKLYESGKLTLGQAAEVAGYSKRTFMELLSDYNVSLFDNEIVGLNRDIENAKRYYHR